ncbi:unnamed protein product [Ilex paraguariensis]|uniref:FBD domain-containing protein n=1 Tax=Ilex paraguariensis TaxID=185542 RepID=A0ABC8U332_9AQUA
MSDSWAIYHHSEFSKYKIELNTPALLLLKYSGPVSEVFPMKSLCSLVKVDIEFYRDRVWGDYEFNQRSTTELAQEIYNVHSLHLSGGSIELKCDSVPINHSYPQTAMLTLQMYDCELPVFHNLTFLELGVCYAGWELLPNLLDSSPHLRTLVFKEIHLKMIDTGEFQGEKHELKMVKYFLHNAKVLKTLNIRLLMTETKQEKSEVYKKLLKIRRSSTSCRVVIS